MDWGVLGHQWAVELLGKCAAEDNLRHAYLFTGPQGVGRRTLALRLAQVLNCTDPPTPGDACRKCRTCRQIEQMAYPDLFILEAEQIGGTLRVNQVRDLLHNLALSPYEGKYRVAVLLRFEEAHVSAMNALLKTLEEPAEKVVIILTAESTESLLPTIASRCERLRLRPMPVDILSLELQKGWNVPSDQADLFAHLSAGRPGAAIRMINDPVLLNQHSKWLDAQENLFTAPRVDRFAFAENQSKDRVNLRKMLITWLGFWRDVLILSAGSSFPIANLDRKSSLTWLAGRVGSGGAHRMVASLLNSIELIDRNVNPRLTLEVLMLDLPTMETRG